MYMSELMVLVLMVVWNKAPAKTARWLDCRAGAGAWAHAMRSHADSSSRLLSVWWSRRPCRALRTGCSRRLLGLHGRAGL